MHVAYASRTINNECFTRSSRSIFPTGQSTKNVIPATKTLTIVRPSNVVERTPESSLAEQFAFLTTKWKRETINFSSPADIAMHGAYQRIIGFGPKALPLIMEELKNEPDWWFWALRAITGEDPVPKNLRGRTAQMAQAWLDWWNTHKGDFSGCQVSK